MWFQNQASRAGTSNYIPQYLRGVITIPCTWYLLLAQHSWYEELLPTFNTLRQRQNGRHFPDDIFKWIFLNENVWISINISLKFVPRGPINNIPTLVQVMAWRRSGDKPLSEPMMVRLPTHICITRPQWAKFHYTWKILHSTVRWVFSKMGSVAIVTISEVDSIEKVTIACIFGQMGVDCINLTQRSNPTSAQWW